MGALSTSIPAKTQNSELLRTIPAAELLGISRTTLWRIAESDPTFPNKIVISSRCVGWRKEALLAWMEAKENAA